MLLIMFGYILLTPMGMIYALRKLKRASVVNGDQSVPPSLVRFALDGVRVRDVLDTARRHPEQSLTVRAFTDNWLVPEQHDFVVEDRGKFAGIVSVSMLRYLPQKEWEHTPLGSVTRRIETPEATSDEFVEDVLQRMTDSSITVLPVNDSETGEFIGSISSYEVMEMIVLTAQGHEI